MSSVSIPGMSIRMATRISSKARRAATGSARSILGSSSTMAASSGSITTVPPPSTQGGIERRAIRANYLGCMRMPASMRIDSALMYELESSSSASVANSVE